MEYKVANINKMKSQTFSSDWIQDRLPHLFEADFPFRNSLP